jgi:hypothetical protein
MDTLASTAQAAAASPPVEERRKPFGPPAAPAAPIAGAHALVSADRAFRAALARLTFGISPATIADTRLDWLAHLAMSPGKLLGLAEHAAQGAARLGLYAAQAATSPGSPAPFAPKPGDRRFADEGGPLAFDNAVSPQAAQQKGITSPVAGQADILVVPDLEAGNMLAKQLSFLAGADAAGVVVGARVPIVLTSRADSERTRIASCAVAVLMVRARVTAPAAAA